MLLTGTCGGSPPDSSCTGHRLFTREFIWTVLSEHPKFTITGSMGKKKNNLIVVHWSALIFKLPFSTQRESTMLGSLHKHDIFALFMKFLVVTCSQSSAGGVVCFFVIWLEAEPSPLHSHITDDRTVCFYRCEGAGDKMPKHSHSRFKVSLYSLWTVLKWTGPVTSNQRLCHVRGTVPYQLFHITLRLLKVWMVNMDKTMSIFVQ